MEDFLLKFVEIIVPVLTSFVVCLITLYKTKENNEKALELQKTHYEDSMLISEKKYQEQLKINEENQRLKYLPYLSIIPIYTNKGYVGKMTQVGGRDFYIPFIVKNEGVGIAFCVQLKCLSGKSKQKITPHVVTAIQEKANGGYDLLGVSEPIDTDILRVGNQAKFSLFLAAVDNNRLEIKPTQNIQWEFEILFNDIQRRQYSQRYTFFINTESNSIFRVNSYMPQLITN